MDLLRHLGFPTRFRDWIFALLSTATSRVLINGVVGDPMNHGCGLRQGDPLSPFLFLLVADGLSALLRNKVATGAITPVKVARRGPGVSHLLFADDTLLFFEASRDQALRIKLALDFYRNSPGQCLNFNKCYILFGHACPDGV